MTLGRQPVAFKVVSRDIIHKSDAGGMRLNVADDLAQRTSARCSMTSVRRTS
ncbi:MAG TPA: acetate--CoA ligase family protein [Casimicrobiaceae bacterium]|nr:acetate--CoA ligase family protein [Casimicrobiaceae bacterium]